jgi:hypothetical protein
MISKELMILLEKDMELQNLKKWWNMPIKIKMDLLIGKSSKQLFLKNILAIEISLYYINRMNHIKEEIKL